MDSIHMFLNAQELSLQEMLDTDMKTEIDNVFGHSDLSLSLGELPPLDLDESLGGPSDMPMWFTSNGENVIDHDSESSNSNFNLDFVGNDGAGKMVDPTSVMPCITVPTNQYFNDRSSYVSERSPSLSPDIDEEPFSPEENLKYVTSLSVLNPSRIRVANFATNQRTSFENSISDLKNGLVKTVPIITTSNGAKIVSHSVSAKMQHIQISNVRTLNGNNIQHHVNNKKQSFISKHFVDSDYDDHRQYPKPAYSYSCLIAMALKNSAMGSLPVSEIYNFMCEHFPYFKTAPNGWKNSVRHNLSLNKCFEKIEKPIGNGSQRKGCLWAMNPSKIAKMDEEVQKWSKKDPMAIKKAMVNPGSLDIRPMPVSLTNSIGVSKDVITENLEMLERGELKRDFMGQASTSSGGSMSEDSEDERDMSPQTPQTPTFHRQNEFVDVSSVKTEASSDDDDDESSLTDFDVEVSDNLYDEIQRDDKLNLGVTFTSTVPKQLLGISLSSSAIAANTATARLLQAQQQPSFANKRAKVATSIHGNYVYKPMTGGLDGSSAPRRKTPLLLRGSNGSIGSSLIKVDDNV